MNKEELKKEDKPKGWANLQQQLKEIREESFKQGVWKGIEQTEQKFIDAIKSKIDFYKSYQDNPYNEREDNRTKDIRNAKIQLLKELLKYLEERK